MVPLRLKLGLLLLSAVKVLADSPCRIETLLAKCKAIEKVPSLPPNVTGLFVQASSVNKLDSDFFGSVSLPNLKDLDVVGGDIAEVSPETFSRLSNLEALHLGSTKVRSLPRGVLKGLNHLKVIIVDNSFIGQVLPGIFQDASSELKSIILEHNRIENIVEGAFSALPSLQLLNLDSNRLSELRQNMFEGMTELHDLYLQHNQIRTLPPQVFESLPNLRALVLTSNRLESLTPASLGGLKRLQVLILDENKLQNLQPGCFRSLRDLDELQINNNLLKELKADTFEGLSKLRVLGLKDNQISKIEKDAFKHLDNLSSLMLHRNKLKAIEGFTNLPSLLNVELQNNNITEVLSGAFAGVPQLEELNLNNNPALRTISSDAFSSNSHLKTLSLEGCKSLEIPTDRPLISNPSLAYINLDNAGIDGLNDIMFQAVPELERVALNYNKLTTIVRSPFRSLKKGSIVEVSGNPIVCECALNEMLQWCKEHEVRLEGTCSGNGKENALLSEVNITGC